MDDTTRYARGYTRTTPPERTPRHPTERRRGGREHYDERTARTARTTRESPLVARRESDDGDVRIDLRDESDAFEITVHLPDEQWKADVSVSASAVRVRARPDNPSTEESHDPSTQESENPSTRKSDAVERRVALTRGIAVERAMMVRSDATLTIVLPTVSA